LVLVFSEKSAWKFLKIFGFGFLEKLAWENSQNFGFPKSENCG